MSKPVLQLYKTYADFWGEKVYLYPEGAVFLYLPNLLHNDFTDYRIMPNFYTDQKIPCSVKMALNFPICF